jgi:hypothetical protein
MVRQRKPAYINEQLFDEYLSEGFIPYLANLGRADPFYRQRAICLMDSASPHVFERSFKLLGEKHVLVIALSSSYSQHLSGT